MREDAAPAGFDLAQDITFSITETGAEQVVTMHDSPTPGQPYDKTGVDMTPMAILALLVVVGGLVSLGIGIKRARKEDRADTNEEKGDEKSDDAPTRD